MANNLYFYGTGRLEDNQLLNADIFSQISVEFRDSAFIFIQWKRKSRQDIITAAMLAIIAAKVLWEEPIYLLLAALGSLAFGLYAALRNCPHGALSFTPSSIRGWYWEKQDCHIFEYPYHRITLVEVKKGKVRIELGRGIDYVVAQEFGSADSNAFLRTLKAHRIKGDVPATFSLLG